MTAQTFTDRAGGRFVVYRVRAAAQHDAIKQALLTARRSDGLAVTDVVSAVEQSDGTWRVELRVNE